MIHQSMYRVNLGRGSKAFLASMQLPKWEIVISAKCVRQPYLFSNMSRAPLPSFCESECFSTTHSVSYLELHYSCVITTSYWGHRPKWEELNFKHSSSNTVGNVDSIGHDIWLASVLLLHRNSPWSFNPWKWTCLGIPPTSFSQDNHSNHWQSIMNQALFYLLYTCLI